MPVRYEMVVDCADPARLTRFWTEALGYVPAPPPEGYPTWAAYLHSVGMPEEDLDEFGGIADPDGVGPRIWFQVVPEGKAVKNRLHFDIRASGGLTVPFETRKERIEAEADRLVAAGATRVGNLYQEGIELYAVNMLDPEGNEFDIN